MLHNFCITALFLDFDLCDLFSGNQSIRTLKGPRTFETHSSSVIITRERQTTWVKMSLASKKNNNNNKQNPACSDCMINFHLTIIYLCLLAAAVSNSSTPTPTTSAQQGQPPVAPPPPQYSYQEINVASLAGLAPHIQVNSQVCINSCLQ